ncbi:hypothetical protein [Pedobacter gandavensis]|uniref:hypothetical protein n=1 Tax=Pedobacter gandavensis TaxID=2679963 RepID=UPI00292F15D4|nr:hypothetical protein [Pedobacter gandavensis]
MKTTSPLPIPLDFKIACATYQLSIPEVLQFFIDHVSFYDSLSQKSDDLFRAATNTLLHYSVSIHRESSTSLHKYRLVILKYIQEMIKIATISKQTQSKKRKRAALLVKRVYEIIDRTKAQNTKLILEEGIVLQLSMDFCLLCEIHNCAAEEYLEYFMSKISLPVTHAQVGLNCIVENQAMGFFYKSLDSFKVSDANSAHRNLQVLFIDKIQELHLQLFIIRNFEKRVEKYQELYQDYYQKLLESK